MLNKKRSEVFCTWILIFVLLFLFLSVAGKNVTALNVPIEVKETAGVGSDGYPISVVVPLPKGDYLDVNRFRVVDSSQTIVPAQFDILNRWWADDNSIRHLKIEFQPRVEAYTAAGTGISTYYLRDDGTGNSASTQLSVSETASEITVNTGPLRFIVNKNNFNLMDELWLDTNDNGVFESSEKIINSNPETGGIMVGRLPGDIQYDSERSDVEVIIEEAGPMRAVIKASAVTKYYNTSDHIHGFAVRIYAYADKPYIKVDYQLQNSAKNKKWAWPLYFDSFDVDLNLNLNPSTLKITADRGDGVVESGVLSSYNDGLVLKNIGPVTVLDDTARTTPDSIFRIEQGDGAIEDDWQIDETDLYDAPAMSTFLDISNSDFGVATTIRNFWQTWPNGLKVDADGKLSVQMWPEWSCFWNDDGGHLGWQGSCSNPEYPARLGYWLFDMQHTYKEALFYFHGSDTSIGTLQDWAKTAQYYPVGIVPVSQYQAASATLDMGGMIPIDTKLSTTDERRPTYTSTDFDLTESSTRSRNKFGWNSFYFKDKNRKYAPSTTGGQPNTAAKLITSENPSDYFVALDWGMSSLNIAPQWMSDYNYESDWDLLRLQSKVYPGAYWRSQGAPYRNFMDADWLAGTYLMQKCRDDAHGWWYHVEYSYYLTGNPWAKDWYEFIAEFREGTLDNPTSAGGQSRAVGHHLGNAFQAYRITGDTDILDYMQNYIKLFLRPESAGGTDPGANVILQNAQYGHIPFVSGDDMPYMMSFLIRQVMSYMDEIKDSDPQAWAEAFQFVSGQISANMNYLNWDYRCDPVSGLNNNGEPCQSNSISAYILADPVSWYYSNTGKPEVLANLEDYLDEGINGGAYPSESTYTHWSDQFTGRWTKFVLENDPIRADLTGPAAINDLTASRNPSTGVITLSYTSPPDAVRYHVVYADKIISETADPGGSVTNWWAGGTVGSLSKITSFSPEALPEANYFAVFTFDENDNMAEMSNIATTIASCEDQSGDICDLSLSCFGTIISAGDIQPNEMCCLGECGNPDLGNGLVLNLTFDEDSSTVTDCSGNGNDGTVYGATFTSSGKQNGAFEYDGDGDYISISDSSSLDVAGQFTVSTWIKNSDSTTPSDDWNRIINKKLKYDDNNGWDMGLVDSSVMPGGINIQGSGGSGTRTPCVTDWKTTDLNRWVHVVAVFGDSAVTLYCNGQNKGSASIDTVIANDRPLYVGRIDSELHQDWQGMIDEVAIWNRALSEDEISLLYGETSTCPSGADKDYSDSVSIDELVDFIDEWKSGRITIAQVIEAIGEWKSGC